MKIPSSILAFVIWTTSGLGQDLPMSVDARIDAYIGPFVKAGQFSGVVLAVMEGKIIYEKAYGFAQVEFGVPNTMETRIGIASITKPMTSVILHRLLEQKKLSLTDKVDRFLPDFPSGGKITVEMLARHRSGIPHRVMGAEWEAVPHTSADMAEKIKAATLVFEPGTQELYSSAGYTLLARVLEITSGKTYAQLLQEFVFAPSGMTDSFDFDGTAIMMRRSQDYLLDAGGVFNAPLKDYSFLVGAGSVYSTARDVYRFGEALTAGRLGTAVRDNFVRNNILSSNGSTNGHRATLHINLEKKYGYVLLSNLGSGAFDLIAKNVEGILEGREPDAPDVPAPTIIKVSNKVLAQYVGKYPREGGGGELNVVLSGNSIVAADTKLYPVRPDCFFEYKFFGEVCFLRDQSGAVQSVTWTGTGFRLAWRR
jgi:CubicO group peptidase (beta-lactamase class C family)